MNLVDAVLIHCKKPISCIFPLRLLIRFLCFNLNDTNFCQSQIPTSSHSFPLALPLRTYLQHLPLPLSYNRRRINLQYLLVSNNIIRNKWRQKRKQSGRIIANCECKLDAASNSNSTCTPITFSIVSIIISSQNKKS